MTRRRVLSACVLTGALLGSTWAGAVNPPMLIYVDITCGTYMTASPAGRRQAEAWVTGYLSGVAVQSGQNFLGDLDEGAIKVSLQNYCQTHPLDKLDVATYALMEQLFKHYQALHAPSQR